MAVNWLFDFSPIVAGFIVGFTRQFIVFTGMHLSLTAIILSNLEVYGRDPLIAIYGISALGVAGAAFGAFLRLKNKNNKEIALSAGISAILGITEPGLYGVLVRFKWPVYGGLHRQRRRRSVERHLRRLWLCRFHSVSDFLSDLRRYDAGRGAVLRGGVCDRAGADVYQTV